MYPPFLCLYLGAISSTNYIINDIIYISKDRLHKEKKRRPLAAGTVPVSVAVLCALVLAVLSLVLAQELGTDMDDGAVYVSGTVADG